jgi:2,3-dihydroxybenzoate decarboxylase
MIDRRAVIKGGLLAGAAAAWGVRSGGAASPAMRRIATEEGFNIPEVARATARILPGIAAREPGEAAIFGIDRPRSGDEGPPPWLHPLGDIGAGRIADMDRAGIAMQVMLLSSPGLQLFEAGEARDLSRLANDRLAQAVRSHPDRFAGLAAIPPQDPAFAAQELERAVKSLGLSGAIINSHTQGHYLDETPYRPILEAAAALEVPIYIHPRAPSPQMVGPYLDYGMVGAIWGYAVEVSAHALRLIFSGVFDQLPKLRIVIGHMGEGIPFFLDRIDTHYAAGGGRRPGSKPLSRPPSEIFRDHFTITTSGMNWGPALRLALETLGPGRVMFAADYPFENAPAAVARIDALGLDPNTLGDFYHRNAEHVFGLAGKA